jgi:hypothetical protein
VQAQIVPPRDRKDLMRSESGSSGLTWVVSAARFLTRSTPLLLRKMYTFRPEVIPPLAMVKPTEDISWSMPWVIMQTSSLALSGMASILAAW